MSKKFLLRMSQISIWMWIFVGLTSRQWQKQDEVKICFNEILSWDLSEFERWSSRLVKMHYHSNIYWFSLRRGRRNKIKKIWIEEKHSFEDQFYCETFKSILMITKHEEKFLNKLIFCYFIRKLSLIFSYQVVHSKYRGLCNCLLCGLNFMTHRIMFKSTLLSSWK